MLERIIWGNTILSWIIAFAIVVGGLIAVRIVRYVLLGKLRKWTKKSNTTWDDFVIDMLDKSVLPAIYISLFYYALDNLNLPEKIKRILHVAFLMVVTYFVIRVISAAVRKVIYSFIKRADHQEGQEKQAGGLLIIVNFLIWTLGIVSLISNFGYDVTTLIAGLGIGGIAIALAAQTILGDLFSYFVIFFDRPFEIGDMIVLDDKTGVVEKIGIKTTRLRTLNGEQLICSNTDLTNARVHNYKRLEKRRVVTSIGVTYQTSAKQLAAIPALVKDIIDRTAEVEHNRTHFNGIGDYSLRFEIVYHVMQADYDLHMDKQQEILLAIYSAFEEQGIDFAFPTQTLILQQEKNENLRIATEQLPNGSPKGETFSNLLPDENAKKLW